MGLVDERFLEDDVEGLHAPFYATGYSGRLTMSLIDYE